MDKTHLNYTKLIGAIKARKFTDAARYITQRSYVKAASGGHLAVGADGTLEVDGAKTNSAFGERILAGLKRDQLAGLFAFEQRGRKNSVTGTYAQLYDFLQNRHMPIVEDGSFLAFKGIRADYLDCHSGRFKNRPGDVLEMDVRGVVASRQECASAGFHIGCHQQAGGHGSIMVLVRCCPEHSVCVPCAENSKVRVYRYEVLALLPGRAKPPEMEAPFISLKDAKALVQRLQGVLPGDWAK